MLFDLPCPQSVCRHAHTLTPGTAGPLRGRPGHHCHVPQADVTLRLPGNIPQRPSTVVELMVNRHFSIRTAIILARAGRGFFQRRTVTLFRELIQWINTTRYLDTLDMRVVPKVMSNFFLHANWEQQTKESAVVDGTSSCVILECLVTSIACIT